MEKDDFFERTNTIISAGSYVKLPKNLLPKIISEVRDILKKFNNIITPELIRKLHVSNVTDPKLYCLPKIHKLEKSMRPTVSAIGSPTHNLAASMDKMRKRQ